MTLVIFGANGGLGTSVAQLSEKKQRDEEVIRTDISIKEGVIPLDICDSREIEQFTKNLVRKHPPNLRILFSVGRYDGFSNKLEYSLIEQSVQSNLIGVLQTVISIVSKIDLSQTSLRIVIVTSAAAQVGSADIGYGIAKAGLIGLVRSMSKRFSSEGLVIVGVSPGIFETNMSSSQSSQRRRKAISDTHIGRAGSVDEVANLCDYLLFDAPMFVTGGIFPIAGGQI